MSRRVRFRDERGQASVELMGLLPYMLLAALVVWQLMLVGWATVSASNAARTGSRVEARGGEGREAALAALDGPLRRTATSTLNDEEAEVRVRIPILMPGLTVEDLTVTKTAETPRTT
jgi:hypothetical protein